MGARIKLESVIVRMDTIRSDRYQVQIVGCPCEYVCWIKLNKNTLVCLGGNAGCFALWAMVVAKERENKHCARGK